jgi:hypothetical protein
MDGVMTAHVLAMHAGYRCRHAGVCCTEDWAIPVDVDRYSRLSAALETGRLQPGQTPAAWFERVEATEGGDPVVVGRAGRSCAFFEPDGGRLCAIHQQLGHDALPVACQHFPRVVVTDPRGVFVSLSHVCPTAGRLLTDSCGNPFEIVHEGNVLRQGVQWAGLDARDALPPQVSAGVLWDWPGLSAWEQAVLDILDRETPESAVARVSAAALRLEQWRPQSGCRLADAVEDAFASAPKDSPSIAVDSLDAVARDAAPAAHRHPTAPRDRQRLDDSMVTPAWDRLTSVVNRYLAARAIASAVTHHSTRAGLLAAWLATAYSVLRAEAARQAATAGRTLDADLLVAAAADADRLLVHRIDAARWVRAYQRL